MNNYTEYDHLEEKQLERWIKFNKNVLILGDHGLGKTSIVNNFWEKKGIKGVYLSGATLDPWTDLIGIPKLVKKGGDSVLDFARPQNIDNDIEGIFVDEYNRSHPKVRNALLELMQFKTINGRSFPKLKFVWAAANPDDSENNYDVERLDPAQEDRFHIIVKLANKPNLEYFTQRYGEYVARNAISWHEELNEDLRCLISPRRLDYALDYHLNEGGPIREVFPQESLPIRSLEKRIQPNNGFVEFLKAVENNDEEKINSFLESEYYEESLPQILEDFDTSRSLVFNLDAERLIPLLKSEHQLALLFMDVSNTREDFTSIIANVKKSNGGELPFWLSKGQSHSSKLRDYHNFYEEQVKNLPKRYFSFGSVGDLSLSLKSLSFDDILDNIDCPNELFVGSMDVDSAKHVIKLFYHYSNMSNELPANQEKKYQSILWSALKSVYETYSNFLYLGFYIKGFEKLILKVKEDNAGIASIPPTTRRRTSRSKMRPTTI